MIDLVLLKNMLKYVYNVKWYERSMKYRLRQVFTRMHKNAERRGKGMDKYEEKGSENDSIKRNVVGVLMLI